MTCCAACAVSGALHNHYSSSYGDGVGPTGAAKLAVVSESTVFRWLANPPFRERVEKGHSDYWDRALGIMSKDAAESVSVLRKLLRSDDGRIKLLAAKMLIEQGMMVREVVDLTQQMDKLQQQIEELPRGKGAGKRVWSLRSWFGVLGSRVRCGCGRVVLVYGRRAGTGSVPTVRETRGKNL